jgi:hypothetical protein
VGTVVKTGEADDPIGVMTVLSLQRYRDRPFLGQLREFLLEKCEAAELQGKLKQVRLGRLGRLARRRRRRGPCGAARCGAACAGGERAPRSCLQSSAQRSGT